MQVHLIYQPQQKQIQICECAIYNLEFGMRRNMESRHYLQQYKLNYNPLLLLPLIASNCCESHHSSLRIFISKIKLYDQTKIQQQNRLIEKIKHADELEPQLYFQYHLMHECVKILKDRHDDLIEAASYLSENEALMESLRSIQKGLVNLINKIEMQLLQKEQSFRQFERKKNKKITLVNSVERENYSLRENAKKVKAKGDRIREKYNKMSRENFSSITLYPKFDRMNLTEGNEKMNQSSKKSKFLLSKNLIKSIESSDQFPPAVENTEAVTKFKRTTSKIKKEESCQKDKKSNFGSSMTETFHFSTSRGKLKKHIRGIQFSKKTPKKDKKHIIKTYKEISDHKGSFSLKTIRSNQEIVEISASMKRLLENKQKLETKQDFISGSKKLNSQLVESNASKKRRIKGSSNIRKNSVMMKKKDKTHESKKKYQKLNEAKMYVNRRISIKRFKKKSSLFGKSMNSLEQSFQELPLNTQSHHRKKTPGKSSFVFCQEGEPLKKKQQQQSQLDIEDMEENHSNKEEVEANEHNPYKVSQSEFHSLREKFTQFHGKEPLIKRYVDTRDLDEFCLNSKGELFVNPLKYALKRVEFEDEQDNTKRRRQNLRIFRIEGQKLSENLKQLRNANSLNQRSLEIESCGIHYL